LKKEKKKTHPPPAATQIYAARLAVALSPTVRRREGAQLLTHSAASSQPNAGRRPPHLPPITARRREHLKA